MKPILVLPEKEQKSLWFIGWAITFILGLALCVILLATTIDKIIFSLCLVGWLMLMVPILLWIPAFYRSLEYIIDDDAVKMKKGVFWRKRVTVPYPKITNVDVTQGPVQRMFNIGSIHVQTAGAGSAQAAQAELRLMGVMDLDGLKDTIMERVSNFTFSGTREIKKEILEQNDSQILRHMLKELTAIRKAMERRRS
jgi:uncharacterized protein